MILGQPSTLSLPSNWLVDFPWRATFDWGGPDNCNSLPDSTRLAEGLGTATSSSIQFIRLAFPIGSQHIHHFHWSGLPYWVWQPTVSSTYSTGWPSWHWLSSFHHQFNWACLWGLAANAFFTLFLLLLRRFPIPKAIHFLCSSQVFGPKTYLIISTLFTADEAYS